MPFHNLDKTQEQQEQRYKQTQEKSKIRYVVKSDVKR
jgi:hypothetical protein